MNVKCSRCFHKFVVSQDDIYLDYDVDYDDSTKYVWEELPLLISKLFYKELVFKEKSNTEPTIKEKFCLYPS